MKSIHTDKAPAAVGPYAQAIEAGGWVYTAGQVALKPDGSFLDGDIEVQTTQVFQNLDAVLHAAGVTFANVVKTTVFLSDFNDFARMNAIFEKAFAGHKPARSTVQVARLPKDAKVEIELVAYKG
ncbi:RidA family protein [Roseiterribacter gracilis]|uniref:Reactive intermediate/imine deaminase n=1 Tax=Roseiterribacter gracilis TaxID=2812848 RepID=A0A8S8X6Z9_9PROT|nr:reactive intermediate/imine deaminase [Rhodospirillales bacterium TMPK1]